MKNKSKGRNRDIQEEIERLRKENEELKRSIQKVKKEKEKIEKEYREYRMRHPETTGVKNGKPYIIKPKVMSPLPKKPGARKGHVAHSRRMPEYVDDVARVPVKTCSCCGGKNLSEKVQEVRSRTVENLKICKPVAVRYEIERRYCRDCRKVVEAHFTKALPRARIGLETMLIIVYMKIGLRMPVASIQQFLDDTCDFKLSEGEICLILDQIAEAFGPFYKQLVQDIRNAPARHIDETSWRINGENTWLWAFVTKGEALYKISSSRSHETPLEVLGKKPKGVDIHDRYSAYKTLARKTGKRPQQVCWAHIICNAKELAQFHGENGERVHNILKDTYQEALAFNHMGTEKDIHDLYTTMKAKLLAEPYQSNKCWKFAHNLLKDKDSLFQFVKNPDVEPTNNRAERGLRHSVIARKISGGNKSPKGAHNYETLTSIYHTLKLRKQSLIKHGPSILSTSHG